MAFLDLRDLEAPKATLDDEPEDELEVEVPSQPEPEDHYVNTRGSTLNYVLWEKAREVYCADKNSPGEL